jgi:hypothetical protein
VSNENFTTGAHIAASGTNAVPLHTDAASDECIGNTMHAPRFLCTLRRNPQGLRSGAMAER